MNTISICVKCAIASGTNYADALGGIFEEDICQICGEEELLREYESQIVFTKFISDIG